MKKLLIKLFIKDKDNIESPIVRKKYGFLASIFGIVSNLIICAFKITLGLLFGLISLVADGMNNLTDASSSIISFIGFKLSSKPADKDHPFGHARIEYIAGFIVSLLVALVGVELIMSSVEKLFLWEEAINDPKTLIITVIVLVFSIGAKLYQCFFNYSIGKKINSTSLKATSIDSRNDAISTFVILIGLIISYFTGFNLDSFLGIAVGIFVLISGFKLIIETANPLLGEKPEKELVKALTDKILSYDEILGIHDLQIHTYGPSYTFATLHVEVDSEKDILTTHDTIDNIEKACYEALHVHTVIHMDPVVVNDPYTEEVKKDFDGIIKSIDLPLSIHDFRVVKGPTHTNVVFDVVVPHKKKISDEKLIELIKEKAKEKSPIYQCVIEIDQDYSDFLSDLEK